MLPRLARAINAYRTELYDDSLDVVASDTVDELLAAADEEPREGYGTVFVNSFITGFAEGVKNLIRYGAVLLLMWEFLPSIIGAIGNIHVSFSLGTTP